MPASSSSSMSSQRLAWRQPGALVWASSSTRATPDGGPAPRRRRAPRASPRGARRRGAARPRGRRPARAVYGPAVRLDEADHDVGAALGPAVGPRRAWRRSCRRRGRRRGRSAAGHGSRPSSSSGGHRVTGQQAGSARFSARTLTRGSPRNPSGRPLVCSSHQRAAPRRPAGPGPRRPAATWQRGVRRRDVGVEPAAARGERVGGTGAPAAWGLARGPRRRASASAVARSAADGPRLLPPLVQPA